MASLQSPRTVAEISSPPVVDCAALAISDSGKKLSSLPDCFARYLGKPSRDSSKNSKDFDLDGMLKVDELGLAEEVEADSEPGSPMQSKSIRRSNMALRQW